MRLSACVVAALIAVVTAACDPAGPQPVTSSTTGPELSAGQGRLFLMREHSFLQGPVRAEVALNDTLVAELDHKSYTYLDLPAGKYLMSVAGLPTDGAWRMAVEIGAKQASYILIMPNKRPVERNTLFQESRKFDLQGGPFIVRTTDAETGEGLLDTMTYSKPRTQAIRPAES